MVTHKFRSKTVKMDISENILIYAENGDDWAIRRIFEIYLKLCHYQRGKLQYRSIKFWRIDSEAPKQTLHTEQIIFRLAKGKIVHSATMDNTTNVRITVIDENPFEKGFIF